MVPVGIFDSGVGGLSVLAEFGKLAPGHPVLYLADQDWAPYGERSLSEVRRRAVAITEYLISSGCDLIVVACNSASAAALHHLREVFPDVLFVGMEPAVKPAATQSESGIVGVLATDATFQGELYASVVDRHANGAEIVEQACPGLAAAIEDGGVDAAAVRELVAEYVAPLRAAGVDTIVLGCTHYPFVLEAIAEHAGSDTVVIDPAPAVARHTLRLLGTPASGGEVRFMTTGEPRRFAGQIKTLLGVDSEPAQIAIGMPAAVPTRYVAVQGDLTREDVDAVVNAANTHLQHGGGVAAAIASAGGPAIQAESNGWVAENGPLLPGAAAVTTAGNMAAQHVIHVAGPIYREGQDNEGLLRAAVAGALEAAMNTGSRTIAFPAISAGIYGYPIEQATSILADEVVGWSDRHPGILDEVRLVALTPDVVDCFVRGLESASS
jgi:glutamate racemase